MKILFPDTSFIESMEGIELMQGTITKHAKPVLWPEYPWEEMHTYVYGSVIKRGPRYRMWYQSYVDGYGFFVNYARSSDGVNWEKPLVRNYRFDAGALYPTVALDGRIQDFYSKEAEFVRCKTNIVSTYHVPSVVYDKDDKERPYKMFGFTDSGYNASFSRDGTHFREYENNPVISLMKFPDPATKKTWFSDVSPVIKDEKRNKFVAFVKTYIIDEYGKTRRCVGFSESLNFTTWSEPETIWIPSAAEDRLASARGFKWADFYGLCGFNYGNCYLGFLWMFYIDFEVTKGTHEGKIEVYLAMSKDGKQWKRFSDEPFIALDEKGWDTDMIVTASTPVFDDDRSLIYYSGSNFSHGVGHEETGFLDRKKHGVRIGMASLRRDGFAYAYSSDGGHFITKDLSFNKGYLLINADTKEGEIEIEILNSGGRQELFTMKDMDCMDYKVKTNIKKGPATIRATIRNAKLYSMEAV